MKVLYSLFLAMAAVASVNAAVEPPTCSAFPDGIETEIYANNPQCGNYGAVELFKFDCPGGGCSSANDVDLLLDGCVPFKLSFSDNGKRVVVVAPSYVAIEVKGGTCPGNGPYPQGTKGWFKQGSGNYGTPCDQDISHIEMCIQTDCCHDGSALDDPHMKTWGGEWFDYQGECDLELMHVPKFDGKVDLDVHVRTTIQYDYSYIEAAALRIGDDILEVTAWGEYAVNGVEDAKVNSYLDTQSHIRTNYKINQIGGYPIYHTMLSKKKHQFDVILGPGQNITLSNHKEFVSVKTHHVGKSKFGGVTGFLGNYEGQMLARDGVTDMSEDPNAFAQEWQVRNDEPMLFRTAREPQFPAQCRLPSQADAEAMEQRRLGEGISEEQAEAACAHLKKNEHEFKACVYDVTATNDLDMAQSGAY